MRNLYKIFDENIAKEEERKVKENEKILNDKINDFYEKINFIKDSSDLYLCYENDYLNLVKEILNMNVDYKLKNNDNASYDFIKMLYDFELNTVNKFYDRVSSLNNTNMNESLILILNAIKNFEKREMPNKIISELDKNIKNILENNIKKINNKVALLEVENIKKRRNYEINEVKGYYAYKLFIQMIMDRLYMESINNKNENVLDNGMLFTFKISLSKTVEINKNSDTIKLPEEVKNHFMEYIKLFIERNKFKYTNISNKVSDKMMYYIIANTKDLIDACYREIQGFEYNDELIKENIDEENINLDKECENLLTLKIE